MKEKTLISVGTVMGLVLALAVSFLFSHPGLAQIDLAPVIELHADGADPMLQEVAEWALDRIAERSA